MTDARATPGIVLNQTENGQTRTAWRFHGESIWLTQTLRGESLAPTIRRYRIVGTAYSLKVTP